MSHVLRCFSARPACTRGRVEYGPQTREIDANLALYILFVSLYTPKDVQGAKSVSFSFVNKLTNFFLAERLYVHV